MLIKKTVEIVRRDDIEDEKGNYVVPTSALVNSSAGPTEVVSSVPSNTTEESSPRGDVYLKDNGSKCLYSLQSLVILIHIYQTILGNEDIDIYHGTSKVTPQPSWTSPATRPPVVNSDILN